MIYALSLFTAESEGFEPPVQLPVHRISSAAHSTTLAAFQSGCKVTNFLRKRTKKEIKRTGDFLYPSMKFENKELHL